jgi:hypothetical protein
MTKINKKPIRRKKSVLPDILQYCENVEHTFLCIIDYSIGFKSSAMIRVASVAA